MQPNRRIPALASAPYTNAVPHLPRRRVLQLLAAMGAGTAAFHRALAVIAEQKRPITMEDIQNAEWIAGLTFTDEKRQLMADGVNDLLERFDRIRAVPIDNAVPVAAIFAPHLLAPDNPSVANAPFTRAPVSPIEQDPPQRPGSDEDLAFLPVTELAALLRTRRVSSMELTRLYLDRLRRFDPALRCVITLTEETALTQAQKADDEIAAGHYRGPLHGVPWGVKDLFAFPGHPTTWGAKPFRKQTRAEKATVIARMEHAGAVLLGKLSVGALAWGDVWFDATTKNPWNPQQGSSGSSAGSAAATAAGLVACAVGTETWGSIVSPCTRCGATGLRPTFGRVSRFGCMALCWSMDKVGPIARTVEDCALVFGAIHGADGLDPAAVDRPFHWPPARDLRTIRVGYVASMFDPQRLERIDDERRRARLAESLQHDREVLNVLRSLDLTLTGIELPDAYPIGPLSLILTAEAAAAFDELTRTGRDDELVRQVANAWPNEFRKGQLIPAVEYLRAGRIRTLLIQEMEKLFRTVDVYLCPSFGGSNLLLTNLTGHPCVVVPNGFRAGDSTPTSITFNGRLFGETELLAVAHAYQQATGFHLKHPPLAPSAAAPEPADTEE